MIDVTKMSDGDLIALNTSIVLEWEKRYPSPPPPNPEIFEAVIEKLVVVQPFVNVRQLPSLTSPIEYRVYKNDVIEVYRAITEKADGYYWRSIFDGKLWLAQQTISGNYRLLNSLEISEE